MKYETQFHALQQDGSPYPAKNSTDFSGKFTTDSVSLAEHMKAWTEAEVPHVGACIHGRPQFPFL